MFSCRRAGSRAEPEPSRTFLLFLRTALPARGEWSPGVSFPPDTGTAVRGLWRAHRGRAQLPNPSAGVQSSGTGESPAILCLCSPNARAANARAPNRLPQPTSKPPPWVRRTRALPWARRPLRRPGAWPAALSRAAAAPVGGWPAGLAVLHILLAPTCGGSLVFQRSPVAGGRLGKDECATASPFAHSSPSRAPRSRADPQDSAPHHSLREERMCNSQARAAVAQKPPSPGDSAHLVDDDAAPGGEWWSWKSWRNGSTTPQRPGGETAASCAAGPSKVAALEWGRTGCTSCSQRRVTWPSQ